jgi:ABC-type uncharacterized transport system substrate-binding protein
MAIDLHKASARASAVFVAALAMAPIAAQAHPHMWVTTRTTVVYENGAFTGVKLTWIFDEFYASTAIEGLDKNKDGKYDREELAELAKVNVEGLKDFEYFTFPKLAGQPLKVGDVTDYWLEHKDGELSLHFTLPFAQPVLAEAKGLTIAIQDPTFYIAFEPSKTDPVQLSANAPKTCKAVLGDPDKPAQSGLGEAASAQLGAFGIVAGRTVMVGCDGP